MYDISNFADAKSEKICGADIQYLRGLIVSQHFKNQHDEGYDTQLEHGCLPQHERIMGYLNHLEDEILNPFKLKELKLEDKGLGSLEEISTLLWKEMQREIVKNGYSDLTLNLEGASRGIREIIEVNNIGTD